MPEEALPPFLLIEAPRLLFPFARQVISEAVSNTGFPPLMLDPIDFASAYMAQVEAQQQQASPEQGAAPPAEGPAKPDAAIAGEAQPMNLARSLGSVGGLTLVSRILALVRDTLQASYVGANFASDAFFVAFRLPNMFRALFAEGAFSAAFIPMFNRKWRKTDDVSARASNSRSDARRAAAVLVLLTVVMLIAAWPITGLSRAASGDPTHEQFAFAVQL